MQLHGSRMRRLGRSNLPYLDSSCKGNSGIGGGGSDCNRIFGLRDGEFRTLRAMMELARREPIVENGLKGQASYRLYPAPVRTGSPSCLYS